MQRRPTTRRSLAGSNRSTCDDDRKPAEAPPTQTPIPNEAAAGCPCCAMTERFAKTAAPKHEPIRVEACGARRMQTRNAGLRKREASARRTCVRFPYSGCGLPTSARSNRRMSSSSGPPMAAPSHPSACGDAPHAALNRAAAARRAKARTSLWTTACGAPRPSPTAAFDTPSPQPFFPLGEPRSR